MSNQNGLLRLVSPSKDSEASGSAEDRRRNQMSRRTYVESDHSVENLEFIRKHAKPGAIILIGGTRLLESVIRHAQRMASDGSKNLWSHICVYQGIREDGSLWMHEVDLDFREFKLIKGYMESPVENVNDPKRYANIAIMDFSLTTSQRKFLFSQIKKFAQRQTNYSILAVLKSFFYAILGKRSNIFKKRYDERVPGTCSSFVRGLYLKLGIDLAPGVDVQATFPEDIFRTPLLHQRHLIIRQCRRKRNPPQAA
jgi:hypothetical protein